jgi:predicted nucleic acid-binding protein
VIVVDTNVIAYLWLPGEHGRLAEGVARKDPDWCAPLLWRSEFRNVLATAVRAKRMDLARALAIAGAAEEHLAGRELTVPSARVLELAAGSGRSAHDCEFVALAEDLDVPLITTDRRLARSFPKRAVAAAAFVRS